MFVGPATNCLGSDNLFDRHPRVTEQKTGIARNVCFRPIAKGGGDAMSVANYVSVFSAIIIGMAVADLATSFHS
jgi:hypothetical protein